MQREVEAGQRHTLKYQDNAEVKNGDLFILDGQKVIVADLGDPFVSDYGRPDRRLRVVYDTAPRAIFSFVLSSVLSTKTRPVAALPIRISVRSSSTKNKRMTCRPDTFTCLGANRNNR